MSRIGQPFSCEEHKHDLGSPLPGACDSCGCVCVCVCVCVCLESLPNKEGGRERVHCTLSQ